MMSISLHHNCSSTVSSATASTTNEPWSKMFLKSHFYLSSLAFHTFIERKYQPKYHFSFSGFKVQYSVGYLEVLMNISWRNLSGNFWKFFTVIRVKKIVVFTFILPNEAELFRLLIPKMSYFITVGLVLSDFVSEESKRPYFECVRDTILAMFTSENTNFRVFKAPGPRMRITFGPC